MAIKEIAQLGANVLRQQAAVVDINAQTRQIIVDMKETLAMTQGIGIAAPQIGESVQIMIMASRPTLRYPNAPIMPATVMMNPSFKPLSEHKEKDWEGCLSVPSIRALVPRYTEIEVNYWDEQGEHITRQLQGFVARVFQHEFDHLQGKVFLDRVENSLDIVAESEYFKLINLCY